MNKLAVIKFKIKRQAALFCIPVVILFLKSHSLGEENPSHHHEMSHEHQHHSEPDQAVEVGEESLYNITDRWRTSEGKNIQLKELGGKPQILAMIYTSCQYACPLITADMKKIEAQIPEKLKDKVGFALLSFDPQRDTPQALKKYSKTRGLNTERWKLLTSTESGVRNTAAALGIRYKKDSKGDFNHSNIIFLLDKTGQVKHQQVGLNQDPEPMLEEIKNLFGSK